jgi:hypothetical protein
LLSALVDLFDAGKDVGAVEHEPGIVDEMDEFAEGEG